jgi:hypothetical protein
MRNGRHIMNYCREMETEVCAEFMDNVAMCYAGLSLLCVAFLMATVSGFLAPRVIERWKRESDRQDFSRLNLYTH